MRVGAGLASPAPARCAPPAGFGGGGEGPESSEPPSWRGLVGTPAGLARPTPSPFPGCPGPEGGRRDRGPGVPIASPWKPPRGSRPSLARPFPGLVPSGRRGPARPPEAAGGGVFAEGSRRGAEPAWPTSDPACRGPRGRAEGQGCAVGEAQGLRAEGTALGQVPSPGKRWPSRRARHLPREAAGFPGCLIRALWAPALPPPPGFLASLLG